MNARKYSLHKQIVALVATSFVLVLCVGSIYRPDFWLTPDQRGEFLMSERRYTDAAKVSKDPWHVAVAEYRNGDFELAAKSFARVGGPAGAFDQANSWLIHGDYDKAIHWYDRALQMQPNWNIAQENRSIAVARKKKLEAGSKAEEQESADAYKPDEIKFDAKGQAKENKPVDLADQQLSDEQLRETWLRRVRTTPADFLRFKFAYQAQQQSSQNNDSGKAGGAP